MLPYVYLHAVLNTSPQTYREPVNFVYINFIEAILK